MTHTYLHSIIMYGIIIWGNRSHVNQIFINRKRAVRILKRASSRKSCRDFFKELKSVTLPGLHIVETLKFVKGHPENFPQFKSISSYNTRYKFNNGNNFKHTKQYCSLQYNGAFFHTIYKFTNRLF
uniref:Uncharacterized protein n=1 Tax=Cacopsylla melanoneura TaxID=428564 RepID=A0A8D8RTF7_9HEMI